MSVKNPVSTVPTSVKFTDKTKERLVVLSEALKIPAKTLIEVAVDLMLDRVDEAGAFIVPTVPQKPERPLTEEDARRATEETIKRLVAEMDAQRRKSSSRKAS